MKPQPPTTQTRCSAISRDRAALDRGGVVDRRENLNDSTLVWQTHLSPLDMVKDLYGGHSMVTGHFGRDQKFLPGP